MKRDDVVKGSLGLETKIQCGARIEVHRPAGHDTGDLLVRLAADQPHGVVSSDTPKRLDLFGDRARYAGHAKRTPRPDRLAVDRRGMDQETDGRTRRRVPMAYLLRDGNDGLLADEWLTDNAREKSGRRPVRLAGTHT